MSAVEGLNHHGITVADIDRSLRFFVDVLGFDRGATVELDEEFTSTVTGVRGSTLKAVFVHGPGVDIELLQYHEPGPHPGEPLSTSRPGSAHLALFVDDIRGIVDAANAVGWAVAGAIAPIASGPRAGGHAAYLRDADGVTVELVERPAQLVVDTAPLGRV